MKDKTKFIILGGLGEIGKNMYAIEHNEELIIIDAHTYECNRKLYTGHGLDVALLDRVSGIDRLAEYKDDRLQ